MHENKHWKFLESGVNMTEILKLKNCIQKPNRFLQLTVGKINVQLYKIFLNLLWKKELHTGITKKTCVKASEINSFVLLN